MAWFAFLIIFALASFEGLHAGQSPPHMSAPIIFNRNDPFDSPRIRLTLFEEEKEFLFDTGTDPTMFFHGRVGAGQDHLARLKRSDGLYRGIPLQGPFEGLQIEYAMDIPDTPFEDFKTISGLFSPQSIMRGVKVIDLIEGVFHVFPEAAVADVLKSFEIRHGGEFRALTWFGEDIGPVPPLFVEGTVGSQPPGLLDLDTGSFRSRYVFSPDDPEVAFRKNGFASDIFGNTQEEQETVSSMVISVAGHPVGEAHIGKMEPGEVGDYKVSGTLGMDVLKGCVIVLPEAKEKRFFLLCEPEQDSRLKP